MALIRRHDRTRRGIPIRRRHDRHADPVASGRCKPRLFHPPVAHPVSHSRRQRLHPGRSVGPGYWRCLVRVANRDCLWHHPERRNYPDRRYFSRTVHAVFGHVAPTRQCGRSSARVHRPGGKHMTTATWYLLLGVVVVTIGALRLLMVQDLVARLIALNITGSGSLMVLVSLAARSEPIDPVLSALVITGLVITAAFTAIASVLIRRIEDTPLDDGEASS